MSSIQKKSDARLFLRQYEETAQDSYRAGGWLGWLALVCV